MRAFISSVSKFLLFITKHKEPLVLLIFIIGFIPCYLFGVHINDYLIEQLYPISQTTWYFYFIQIPVTLSSAIIMPFIPGWVFLKYIVPSCEAKVKQAEKRKNEKSIPMTKDDLKKLRGSLVELMKELGSTHEMDWFHTLGSNVDYKAQEYNGPVKAEVDHVMGGMSILYLFAILESYFKPKYWEGFINEKELLVLRAYRHVRHSIAHHHGGKRVKPRTPLNQIETLIEYCKW